MAFADPLLFFPMKRAESVDWVKPMRTYIKETVSQHEADELAHTLEHMSRLRKAIKEAAEGREKATEQLVEQTFYPYVALVLHAMAHVPLVDGRVKLSFGWYDAAYRKKVSLPNANYEVASVFFNVAAIYYFLGAGEDRATSDGAKAAFKHFQTAAGLLEQCKARVATITDRLPPELSADGLAAFSSFTLAAAHQCCYLKAAADTRDKSSLLAKLAMEGSALYEDLHRLLGHPALADVVDRRWLAMAEFYKALFEARAHHHLAEDLHRQAEIGQEIGRLNVATALLEKCANLARQLGGNFGSFLQTLQGQVQKCLSVAVSENEKIYHERVPARDAVKAPDRLGKTPAKPTPLGDLFELTKVADPFGHITPVHILDAHNKFRDEMAALLNKHAAEVNRHQERLRDAINRMGVMGIIGTFESRSQALPRSLLERIRAIQAAARNSCPSGSCLEHLAERRGLLASLADSVVETIQRLLGLLDAEAKGDRDLRGKFTRRWTREASEKVNQDLVVKLTEYSKKVQQAKSGDSKIDEKLKLNFDSISRLALPEDKLQALLPAPGSSPDDQAAQRVVGELKELLKQMTDKENAQRGKLQEIRELLEQDSKDLPLKLAAGGKEREAMVLEEAGKRYEEKSQYIIQLTIDADNLQNQIITAVEQLNKVRRNDPANVQREEVLNSLDQACNKYEEISANIAEGVSFYARVSEVMDQFKAKVEDFVFARNVQKDDLLKTIQDEAAHVEQEQDLMSMLRELEAEQQRQQDALQAEKAKQEQLRQAQQTPQQPWHAAPSTPPPAAYAPSAPYPPPYGSQAGAVPPGHPPAHAMTPPYSQPTAPLAQPPHSPPQGWPPQPYAVPQYATAYGHGAPQPPPPTAPYPAAHGAPQYSYQAYPGAR